MFPDYTQAGNIQNIRDLVTFITNNPFGTLLLLATILPAWAGGLVSFFHAVKKWPRPYQITLASTIFLLTISAFTFYFWPEPANPFDRFAATVTDCDRLAASNDDPDAQSESVPLRDLSKSAVPICHKAAQEHPDEARFKYQLGRAYESQKLWEEAGAAYKDATRQNYNAAYVGLASLYISGKTKPDTPAAAKELLQRADDANNCSGMIALGTLYEKEKKFAEAAEQYRRAATLGRSAGARRCPTAWTKAGLIYDDEAGEDWSGLLDYKRAREYYENAMTDNSKKRLDVVNRLRKPGVADNDAEAAEYLGYLLTNGMGGPRDCKRGLELFRFAAHDGNTKAMMRIGYLYKSGKIDVDGTSRVDCRSVAVNFDEAVKWFKMGSERNGAGAMAALAEMLDDGQGIDLDVSAAAEWLMLAARRGNNYAKSELHSGLANWKPGTRRAVRELLKGSGLEVAITDSMWSADDDVSKAIEKYLQQ